MRTHRLKCWPDYFKAIQSGGKQFDLRKDDRGYEVGDFLLLEEFRPATGEYTGRITERRITFILRDFPGLEPGYCVLGIVNPREKQQ